MSPQRTASDPNEEWEYPLRDTCQTPSQVSSHVEGSLDDAQAEASLMPDDDMMPEGSVQHTQLSSSAVVEHTRQQGAADRAHHRAHQPSRAPPRPHPHPQAPSQPPRVAQAPFPPDVYFDVLAKSNGDLQQAAGWLQDLGAPLGVCELEQLAEAATLGHWERLEVFNMVMEAAMAPHPDHPQDASLVADQAKPPEAAYLQPATPLIGEDERRTGTGGPPHAPSSSLVAVDGAARAGATTGGEEGGAGGAVDVEGIARGAGAPSHYFCSISTELMRDPVIVATGQTYERKAIANWVKSCEQGRKPVTCPVTRQELKKPIMMFPNYALRNSIEEWAGEHAPIILGPDGHVLESEPEPEDASPAARPTQNPPGAAAVVGNPLRAQPGQDSHNSRTQVEGAERRSRNPNSWLNTGLVVREMFVPLCCILMASLQSLVWFAGMDYDGWALDSRHNNPLVGPTAIRLREMGAACTVCVQDDGEWWRLVSAGFLFAGWWHLAFSVFGTVAIGYATEKRYGFVTVVAIFSTSLVLGSICSHLFVPQQVSVAGSAVLFGLLGAFLADVMIFRESRDTVDARMFIVVTVSTLLNLIAGVMPYADMFAHIGGLVGGFLAGVLAMAPSHTEDLPPGRCNLWPEVQFFAGVSIIGLAVGGSCMIQWSLGSDNWCEVCPDISCMPTNLWDCQSSFYETSRVMTASP
eukprot:CAMPEP_0114256762 /NCGR_PEP_ID=MMETSP0058-20121206/18351_1 /TAXON_ID=36894 /ORGANISM="Pyramimonas parkeae, CCMP726" /LENGTH=691 /DNA_ID=CAMNT_0001371401 /DNA_START=118 /DNA_END=2193 /DNA_ORIENTATION=+